MEEFNIGGVTTYRMTKRELIDVINKTFPDEYGTIAVITECKTTKYPDGESLFNQSITFGKTLEI